VRLASAAHVDFIAGEVIQEQATHVKMWCRSESIYSGKEYIQEIYKMIYRKRASLRWELREALLVALVFLESNVFFGFDFVAAGPQEDEQTIFEFAAYLASHLGMIILVMLLQYSSWSR
jgi:hypothetical protein